jgi:hypothetical protein
MEVHTVDGLVDGDVRESALQATTVLFVDEGAPASLKWLPVANLRQLALLEVAKVAGQLVTLSLVGHQPPIQIREFLLLVLELLIF